MRTRAGKIRAGGFALFTVAVLALLSGVHLVADPFYEEGARNLLIRGNLKVLGDFQPSGTETNTGSVTNTGAVINSGTVVNDGTVTNNSTVTNNGVVVMNSRQMGLIPWVTTYDPINDDGFEVTGLDMPDTNYMVELMTTENVTPIAITIIDRDSFSVEIEAAVPADVTQRYKITPTDQAL